MFNQKILFKTLSFYGVDLKSINFNNHSETVNHMVRCANIAHEFGKYLGLSKKDLEKLTECALLHDIGKFYVNPEILYKEGRLTDEEFMEIKRHTDYDGLLKKADMSVRHCIRYHHDNVVKTGYHKIDVSKKHDFVKIISLIDCYDVMSNKRCYKDYTLTIDEIIEDIYKNLGRQFDLNYGHKFIGFLTELNCIDCVS